MTVSPLWKRFVAVLSGPAFFLLGACSAPPPNLEGIKQEIRSRFPSVTQISAETLARWEKEKSRRILLVDAREPSEYAVSHLQGAVNLQHPEAVRKALEEADYSSVVVYCSVGYRSSQLAERLQKMGLKNVFNLEGSIFEWANQGRPIYDASGPARFVHPYDDEWGRLLRPELRAPSP